jgi:1,4-dihydroxy-2-naphthoate octaprenyltransferase
VLWVESLIGVPNVTPEQWHAAHPGLRWLIASRASVLPLTIFAVLFAGALAQPRGLVEWTLFSATLVALVLAHATNNLLNDLVDDATGLDTDNYFRIRYGTQVLAAGLVSRAQFARYLAFTGTAALGLGTAICFYRGATTMVFAGLGAFFLLFYTHPLKRLALGELAVFLTWGPLMAGGVVAAVTGSVTADAIWAGALYGLGPTVVIFAKHTDKATDDQARGVVTLPVLLGARGARLGIGALAVIQMLAAVGIAYAFGLYGVLATLCALPQLVALLRIVRAERPTEPPSSTAGWPLWFTVYGFQYARAAGAWLTVGVLAQAIWPA